MSAAATIRGSWGDLLVDRATGYILAYDSGGRDGWQPDDVGYDDILFFLPETLAPGRDACLDKHGETDILFVGFVTDRGHVVMPMIPGVGDDHAIDPALLPRATH